MFPRGNAEYDISVIFPEESCSTAPYDQITLCTLYSTHTHTHIYIYIFIYMIHRLNDASKLYKLEWTHIEKHRNHSHVLVFLGLVKDMCCPKISFAVPCWRSSHFQKSRYCGVHSMWVHLGELIWLVVSIQLNHIGQNANLPQEGVNKNVWNHHLVIFDCCCYSYHSCHTRPK